MTILRSAFATIVISFTSSAYAQNPAFDGVRNKVLAGEKVQALSILDGAGIQKLESKDQALASFARGILLFEGNKFSEAKVALEKSIELKTNLLPYATYYLGLTSQQLGEFGPARKHLDAAVKLGPPRHLQYQARFHLAEMDLKEKKWAMAGKHFAYLERRWRSSVQYPEVLWGLIQVEQNSKRQWNVCRWARRLYSGHPQHALVKDWGIDLQNAMVEGKRLGCLASFDDQSRRMRRLQWAGESDRARREIETLKARAPKSATYIVDRVLANFLIHEGYVEDAVRLLLPYHGEEKKNLSYLSLLARAAARAGEFPTAVGAYTQAHELAPRSQAGREALYQAAFLSYQFQDYDGAARKFERFIKIYPTSGLSRDAKWHLAWNHYLKGDYESALQGFASIKVERKRWKRRWRKVTDEKILYWMAMSYLRLEDYQNARKNFEEIVLAQSYDYYSRAASSRLKSLPTLSPELRQASAEREIASVNAIDETPAEVLEQEALASDSAVDENDSEEALAKREEEALEPPDEPEAAAVGEEALAAEDGEDEMWKVSTFRDPRLRKRFVMARDLISVGFNDMARYELYEIERRTRYPAYLKMLISAYDAIEAYNRSSAISNNNFAAARIRGGFEGARDLWESSYPQAYKASVDEAAKKLAIPSDWIWSIMRAESNFRADVSSPVGAKGLMQLMPGTARQVASLMGMDDFDLPSITKPDVNIQLGSRYLQRLAKKFDTQLPLVAAGYNAGPHRVENWLSLFGNLDFDEFIEHIPFLETRNYVKRVTSNYMIYQTLYRKNPDELAWLRQPVKFTAVARPATRESWD